MTAYGEVWRSRPYTCTTNQESVSAVNHDVSAHFHSITCVKCDVASFQTDQDSVCLWGEPELSKLIEFSHIYSYSTPPIPNNRQEAARCEQDIQICWSRPAVRHHRITNWNQTHQNVNKHQCDKNDLNLFNKDFNVSYTAASHQGAINTSWLSSL